MSWGGYVPGHLPLPQGMDLANFEKMLQETKAPLVAVDEPVEFSAAKAAEFQTVPPRDNLIWAAVDLDGTLAEGVWTPDNPTSEIGPMKVYPSGKSARDLVDELYEAGYKVVVHTARGYTDYENIERWLLHNKIRFRHIICGKVLAATYVDDRNRDIFDQSWVPGQTTRASLAWAAGFYDGEGCTSYGRSGRKNLYPRMGITQKHREVLDKFRDAVDLGSVYESKKAVPFSWQVSGSIKVAQALTMLWPDLGTEKRLQAYRVWDMMLAAGMTPEHAPPGWSIDDRNKDINDESWVPGK